MRVWFNHWFSTIYPLMKSLKDENPNIYLIGSNRVASAVYRTLCEEFYVEPSNMGSENYLDWCINFCKEHKVDVFVPRGNRVIFSKNKNKFLEIGTQVLVDDNSELVEILEDKIETKKYFDENSICGTPDMFLITSISDFEDKYKYLKKKYKNRGICMKYPIDEGGISFRVIFEEDIKSAYLPDVFDKIITYNMVLRVLNDNINFKPFILMPFLDDPEISVDSLMTDKGFICVSRKKVGTRATLIYYDPELSEISKKFAEISGIKTPYNMQFRLLEGKYVLLEVNTRISGGCYKDLFVGIDTLSIYLKGLLGEEYTLPDYKRISEKFISIVETPIIMNL